MAITLNAGNRVLLSGDSAEMWLADYNVRLSTGATVLEPPAPHAKKVLVCIDEIDHDTNVTTYVKRAACRKT